MSRERCPAKKRKRPLSLLVSTLVVVFVAAGGAGTSRPNVVLILADALRQDYVGAYNGSRFPTRNIDRLARVSVRFTWAYTPIPMSGPAYTSVFTGLYPQQHNLLNNRESVPAGVWWLPEELRWRGYQTAAFMSNGYCDERFGFQRGFDYFWSDRSRGKEADQVNRALLDWLPDRDTQKPLFLFLVYMDPHTPYFVPELQPNLALTLDGREVDRRRADNVHLKHQIRLTLAPGLHDLVFHRLFPDRAGLVAGEEIEEGTLNIVTMSVQPGSIQYRRAEGWGRGSDKFREPYSVLDRARLVLTNPTPAVVEAQLTFQGWQDYAPGQFVSLYGRCVSYLDTCFGRTLDALKAEGLFPGSLVIFFSDHGQGLGDHDLLDHVDQLYDSLLRVPLLVHWPGMDREEVRAGPASLLDIPSTVLAAVGVEELAPALQGLDLATLPADDVWERRPLFADTFPPEAPERLTAVLFRGRKLILRHATGSRELYHLLDDPRESRNLAPGASDPELEKLLSDWVRDAPPRAGLRLDTLSPESLQELRMHGYLKD